MDSASHMSKFVSFALFTLSRMVGFEGVLFRMVESDSVFNLETPWTIFQIPFQLPAAFNAVVAEINLPSCKYFNKNSIELFI